MQANAHNQRWWQRLLELVTPRTYFGWAPTNVHGRRWWQRRRDIAHLLRLIRSWTPTREADIDRQFSVVTELEAMLEALEPQVAPRHLIDIRGR